MRRYAILAVAGIAVFTLVQPVAALAAPTGLAAAYADAGQRARQTGQAVEVGSLTTEIRRVVANPNGTFTLTSNRRAVRARTDGVWKPIDTTLKRNPDGSLSPAAAAVDVTFSGGGTGPAGTAKRDGESRTLSWPDPLPVPAVAGDTATYAGVLPGVDLALKAEAEGYTEKLVVHDAKAAANPALERIRPEGAAPAGAAYPMTIEEAHLLSRLHWAQTMSNGQQVWDANQEAQVGFCGFPECGGSTWKSRAYFEFDVSPLSPGDGFLPIISSAGLFTRQTWSADIGCAIPRPTAVYESGGIFQGMRWPGAAGGWLDTQFGTGGHGCPAGQLTFDVFWAVRHAADSHRALVLGLAAGDENDKMQWKKFDSNPGIVVQFSGNSRAMWSPPQSTLECSASAAVYTTRSGGSAFFQYQHLEPETGVNSWGTPRQIGTWGITARHLAAPNGVIYNVNNAGEFRRMRWNGSSWDIFANGQNYEIIDTGPLWKNYSTDPYRNRITVDANGDIYTVEPDGNLHWRNYNPTTRTLTHRVVDRGWDAYDLIAAAGDGVIYARGGYHAEIDRYRYHAASQRLEFDGWHMPGIVDWRIFTRMFSPGGDILYGVTSAGDLQWYRYDEDVNRWFTGSGRVVSTGWQSEVETFADPAGCRRVGSPMPQRPAVTPRPMTPVTLLQSADGHVHYSYVDAEGRGVYAEAADLTGGTPVRLAAVPGLTGLTGVTALAEQSNNRVQLAGTGTDAEVLSNVRMSGSWETTTRLGGFVTNSVALSRIYANWTDGRTVAAFGVDVDGRIRYQTETGVNGPMTGWKCFGTDAGWETPTLSDDSLIIVPDSTATHFRVIARDRDGAIMMRSAATLSAHGCDSEFDAPLGRISGIGWQNLGTGFVGQPSVVVGSNGAVNIFAAKADGIVYLRGEFDSGWTALPSGVTAAGAPSAIRAPDGQFKVVIRGTDGFVYYTSQTGSGTYTPWREISGFTDEAGTDPTALAYPAGNTWLVAYRTDLDVPRLRRYQPPALAAAAGPFVNIPVEAPVS